MKKLLTILGMVLLATVFMVPDNAQAQVVPSSPANGAQLTVNSDISVTFNYILPGYPVYNYHIQVSDKSDFSNIVKKATLGSVTSHTFTGFNPARTYYWRVQAYYFNYVYVSWSTWSATYNFKIVVPSLLIPSNNATGQSQPLLLDWRGIADPIIFNNGHQIYVDNNADFSSPEISVKTRSNERSVSGLAYNTKFYWKVRYYFINIKTGATTYYDWSVTRNFTTGCDIPGATALVSPANNATNQSQPVALSWSAVDIADKYNLQLANNASFAPAILDHIIYGTTYNASGLDNGTKYYWRVRAGNECGYGSFTATRNFTTECPEPAPPDLVSPPNGATGLSMPFTLDWNDVATVIYYGVQVYDNSNLSNPVIDEQPSSSQYQVASGLTDGVKYYWRVYTHDDCGNSVWGPSRNFTLACPTPAATTLELPINGASGLSQPVYLDWADALGATRYIVEISFDAGFSDLDRSVDASNSNYSASGLATDGTTYYWRIKSGNECLNWSGWSSVRNFSTECVTAAAPSLVSPADETAGLDIREPILFDWSDVAGNTGYRLQMKDDPGFESPVYVNTPAGVSEYALATKLVSGTTYYWRVRTKNSCGEGVWSLVRSFTPVCPAVDMAMLQSPSNGALSIALPVALNWLDVGEATKYQVQVDKNADFGSLDIDDNNVLDSEYSADGLSGGISYYWRIRAFNGCQWGEWSAEWTFITGEQTDVDIVKNDLIPDDYLLNQNYPNPFNPSTTIDFALPRASYVNLEIHNILGERVETLISAPMSAGSYSVTWDASDVPTGMYFYKIEAGAFSETKKMILVK